MLNSAWLAELDFENARKGLQNIILTTMAVVTL